MSTKVQQKKFVYKPKYEEKQKVIAKFNFVFDQQKITFKTEIPELPAKLKPKPNEQSHKKKVDQLHAKASELKQIRKRKKQQYKKGSQDYDSQIQKITKNIDLGKKCLVVLKYDLENIASSLSQVQQKIQKKSKLVRNLQRGPRENKQQKKTYDQMTYEQLQEQQNKLSIRISTANLNKKEQIQINALLGKLARIKLSAPHGQKPKDNTALIENALDSIERLKIVKQSLQKEQEETKYKVESIEEDIQEFQDQVADLEQLKKNPQNQNVENECKQLKQQIYKIRDEIAKIQQEFENKKTQYEYEQAKVQWIKWATEIQKRKNQQWQAERQQRRKQRLRQKNKQKNGENTANQPGKTQEESKPERRIINKYQKQIDSCSFLIQYCEGLIKTQQPQQTKETQNQNPKNIQSVLKSGQWSKMKDVQVIKSKKANIEDQQPKTQKTKKKKTLKKQAEGQAQTLPQTFNHQFFVQHEFDSVKVVPPNKPQQVQATLKQLTNKLTYFLEHPQGGPRQARNDKGQKEKPKYVPQKYAKVKPGQRQKKVVNTQEFPTLS